MNTYKKNLQWEWIMIYDYKNIIVALMQVYKVHITHNNWKRYEIEEQQYLLSNDLRFILFGIYEYEMQQR